MMVESKETVRERVKRYRLKKKGDAFPISAAMKDPDRLEAAAAVHPVVLKMFAEMDKRIKKLEDRKAGSDLKKLDAEAGEDLFKRVMREKESRLKK